MQEERIASGERWKGRKPAHTTAETLTPYNLTAHSGQERPQPATGQHSVIMALTQCKVPQGKGRQQTGTRHLSQLFSALPRSPLWSSALSCADACIPLQVRLGIQRVLSTPACVCKGLCSGWVGACAADALVVGDGNDKPEAGCAQRRFFVRDPKSGYVSLLRSATPRETAGSVFRFFLFFLRVFSTKGE